MITIGADLGGTNLRVGLMDEEGKLFYVHREKIRDKNPGRVIETFIERIGASLKENNLCKHNVRGLGFAIAAQVSKDGNVAVAPNLGWTNQPFRQMLSFFCAFPVGLFNDLSAAAWGESTACVDGDSRNLLFVSVGSGVGAGIISDGKLLEGTAGYAGEIGHIKVVPGGEPCGCGENGCLEAYCGGHRMTQRTLDLWKKRGISHPAGLINPLSSSQISMQDIHAAYLAGDETAIEVLEEAGNHLGVAIANLITVLNPGVLVLGGGVLGGIPELYRKIEESIQEYSALPSRKRVLVKPARLGDNAGLTGAALLAGNPSSDSFFSFPIKTTV